MVSVNLLPAGIRSARRRNRRLQIWVSAVLAVMMLTAIPLALDVSKSAAAASIESRLEPLQSRLSAVRADLKKAVAEREELTAQIARADALRSKRSWSSLLALLSSVAPDTVWFTSLRTATVAPQRAAPQPAGGKAAQPQAVTLGGPGGIHLEGYALDHDALYAFMSALKDTKTFDRVDLTSAGQEPVLNGTAVRFVLECYWQAVK